MGEEGVLVLRRVVERLDAHRHHPACLTLKGRQLSTPALAGRSKELFVGEQLPNEGPEKGKALR